MKRFLQEFSFPGAWRYRLWMLLPSLVLIGLDQLFKFLAVAHLKEQSDIVLIDGVFELTYVQNEGASFGMLGGYRWFFIVITIVAMLFLLGVICSGKYRQHPLLNVSFVLVLAGGIGNLIDRIVNGYVVDYLYFKLINFPVFNFADCCLVIGAIFMLIFFFFIYEEKKPQKQGEDVADDNENVENT